MNSGIRKVLIQLISESLSLDENNLVISDNTKLFEELGFDSISILNLLTSVENSFNLDFSQCEDIVGVFETIGSLHEYIERVVAL
jgi:acyl carrier protein